MGEEEGGGGGRGRRREGRRRGGGGIMNTLIYCTSKDPQTISNRQEGVGLGGGGGQYLHQQSAWRS